MSKLLQEELAFKDSKVFESLCCDILNSSSPIKDKYVLYGRLGQKQNGIDIFRNKFTVVVQCKCHSNSNNFVKEIENDYKNAMKKLAEYNLKPSHFLVMTSLPRDTEIQDGINAIQMIKKVPIHINFREEIESKVQNDAVITYRYFPNNFKASFINVDPEIIEMIEYYLDELKKGSKEINSFANHLDDLDDLDDSQIDDILEVLYKNCYEMTENAKKIIDILEKDNNFYYNQLNRSFQLGYKIKDVTTSLPCEEIPKIVTKKDNLIFYINMFIKYYRANEKYEQFFNNCETIIEILKKGITNT